MCRTAVGDANSKPFAATPDSVSDFLMEGCPYYGWVLSQQIRDTRGMEYWPFHPGIIKPFLFEIHVREHFIKRPFTVPLSNLLFISKWKRPSEPRPGEKRNSKLNVRLFKWMTFVSLQVNQFLLSRVSANLVIPLF